MKKSVLSRHLSRLGRKGGKARMDSLTEEQRRNLAKAAGKKSGEARRKAKQQAKEKGSKFSGS